MIRYNYNESEKYDFVYKHALGYTLYH